MNVKIGNGVWKNEKKIYENDNTVLKDKADCD